jgi:hypothetical protein
VFSKASRRRVQMIVVPLDPTYLCTYGGGGASGIGLIIVCPYESCVGMTHVSLLCFIFKELNV